MEWLDGYFENRAIIGRLDANIPVGSYNSFSDFNSSNLSDNDVVYFLGRSTPNDGGGGWFTFSSSSTETADGGIVLAPTGGGRLFRDGWTSFGFVGEIYPAWYGADSDGVADSTPAFNAASSSASIINVNIPRGTYLLNTTPSTTANTVWEVDNGAVFTGPAKLADNAKIIKKGNAVTWVSASTLCNGIFAYLEKNTTLNTYARNICSFSAVKASNLDGSPTAAAIGKAAFALNDGNGSPVWGMYVTALKTGDNTGFTHCLEMDIANMGSTVVGYPNSPAPAGATICLWLASGGEATINDTVGTATCAIGIIRNDGSATPTAAFEKGIVFHSKAISGTDGVTGTGVAIAFSSRHSMTWFNSSNQIAGEVICTVQTSTNSVRINMNDFGLAIDDVTSGGVLFHVNKLASPDNYLRVNATVASSSPFLSCHGSDTDIDIGITPKGSGLVKFGTYTAGVVTQAGYVTIKDSGGTSRRLLVG